MAESSTDGIQTRSDPKNNIFLALFRDFHLPSFGLHRYIQDKLRAKFRFLSARESREQASNHAEFYGPDAVAINIPPDSDYGESINGHRATRDDEAAGHSELFNALLPANLTIAYEASNIFKSNQNRAQPLSSKTFGYLTVAFVGAAVFSSLAGLSLSTFKPNTLPFGFVARRMMQIMHNVGVHTTAYAFIGTMCHQFLQDGPFIMWTVAGLASAAFMGLMIFIGSRR